MRTWNPAGEWSMSHACVTSQSPSQGGGQMTSGWWDCFWVNAGVFLRIRSDILFNVALNALCDWSF